MISCHLLAREGRGASGIPGPVFSSRQVQKTPRSRAQPAPDVADISESQSDVGVGFCRRVLSGFLSWNACFQNYGQRGCGSQDLSAFQAHVTYASRGPFDVTNLHFIHSFWATEEPPCPPTLLCCPGKLSPDFLHMSSITRFILT